MLSVLKCLKFDPKFLVPIIIVVGFLFKNVSSNSPVTDDTTTNIEKLPFCDENLINERDVSKR